MTERPEKKSPAYEKGFSIFKGRRLGPLFGPWVSSAIFAGLTYYAVDTLPALKDVAILVYLLLAAIVAITTARWLRIREVDRREHDRRGSRSGS